MKETLTELVHKDLKLKKDGLKLSSHWKHVTEKYKPKRRLGSGASGEVILAKCRRTKEPVAIKHIKMEGVDVQY